MDDVFPNLDIATADPKTQREMLAICNLPVPLDDVKHDIGTYGLPAGMQPVARDLADVLSGSKGDAPAASQDRALTRDNCTSSTMSTIVLPSANPDNSTNTTEASPARPLQRVTSEARRWEAQLRDQEMSTRPTKKQFTMTPTLRILQLPQPLPRDPQELQDTSRRTLTMSAGPPLEVDELWMKSQDKDVSLTN